MSEPASIRTKNPGAMWGRSGKRPSASATVETNAPIPVKWGSTQTIYLSDGLDQGNNSAVFPSWVAGICAQLDLWRSSEHYKNKRFADAIYIWSGGNEVASYIAFCKKRVPDLTENTVMNDAFWQSPSGIAFLKAQAWHEAGKQYPAPDADWIEAQRRVFAGKAPAVILPPGPTPPDVPRPDPAPQVTKPATSTATKAVGAVVIAAAPVIVASQGYDWLEIGLSAFIAAGLVTAVVLLIRKFRSAP